MPLRFSATSVLVLKAEQNRFKPSQILVGLVMFPKLTLLAKSHKPPNLPLVNCSNSSYNWTPFLHSLLTKGKQEVSSTPRGITVFFVGTYLKGKGT